MEDLRGQDVIDSRDVIERIEELENEVADWIENYMEENELESLADDDVPENENDFWDMKEELDELKNLEEEANGSPDWRYGEVLIRDDYFEKYAEELASDIYGNEIAEAHWPFNCIDWEKAADALKYDYFLVTFAEEDYWIRS